MRVCMCLSSMFSLNIKINYHKGFFGRYEVNNYHLSKCKFFSLYFQNKLEKYFVSKQAKKKVFCQV